MRRLFTLALMLLLIGAMAPAASADAPIEFTETVTFEDLNPCDAPNTHMITIVFDVKVHEHKKNTVLVINSSASTDDGFVGRGHETTVLKGDDVRSTFNFVQTHPETGEKFTVKGNFKLAQGEVRVDNFKFNCVIDR